MQIGMGIEIRTDMSQQHIAADTEMFWNADSTQVCEATLCSPKC